MFCLNNIVSNKQQLLLITYVFTGFSKLEGKSCPFVGGRYASIKTATSVCLSDYRCFGITDQACDGASVGICSAHPKNIKPDPGSCVYIRSGNVLKGSL